MVLVCPSGIVAQAANALQNITIASYGNGLAIVQRFQLGQRLNDQVQVNVHTPISERKIRLSK